MSRAISLFCGVMLLAATWCSAAQSLSKSEVERRSEFNYKMFCRGCHSPDGSGRNSVPVMKNYVGHFLKSQAGRDYLVQVPGSANAALDNEQLAQVLNWIVINIGGASRPKNFVPYSAEEVGRLRQNPLFEVVEHRQRLVVKIEAQLKKDNNK